MGVFVMIIIDTSIFFKRNLRSVSRLFEEKPVSKGQLDHQNQRHAHNEIPVLCLVTEGVHADNGAHGPADDGREKEGFLRNPPAVVPCLVFVNAHEGKCQHIDSDQIIIKNHENILQMFYAFYDTPFSEEKAIWQNIRFACKTECGIIKVQGGLYGRDQRRIYKRLLPDYQ